MTWLELFVLYTPLGGIVDASQAANEFCIKFRFAGLLRSFMKRTQILFKYAADESLSILRACPVHLGCDP